MKKWRSQIGACAFAAACFASPARAWVLHEDPFEEESTEVGVVGRSFAFLNAGPTLEPPLAPEGSNPAAQSIFDARAYASLKTSTYRFVVHNQSTMSLYSLQLSGGGLNLGRGVPPPRMLPLTFRYNGDNVSLINATDWLYGELRFDTLTLTIGRQPVSFGRGSAWHTNDLVSTFALTEVDRNFKPGADAIRIDYSLPDRQNLMAIASFGYIDRDFENEFRVSAEGSTGLLQYKKASDFGEWGLMGGYVRGDIVASLDGVANLPGFDLSGELTGTYLTDQSLDAPGTDRDWYVKATVGATFRPTPKLTIIPELFYGGNGAKGTSDYLPLLLSDRFQIGDQTAVGRYYASLNNMWEAAPLTTISWGMMANLGDPSALWYGFLSQNISDNTTGQLGLYAPIGRLPQVGESLFDYSMQSEFGAYPYFFFAQLSATL